MKHTNSVADCLRSANFLGLQLVRSPPPPHPHPHPQLVSFPFTSFQVTKNSRSRRDTSPPLPPSHLSFPVLTCLQLFRPLSLVHTSWMTFFLFFNKWQAVFLSSGFIHGMWKHAPPWTCHSVGSSQPSPVRFTSWPPTPPTHTHTHTHTPTSRSL